MTILAISSQVAWGPVGNSATVPALESLGHTVVQLPTIILSHHPGHGKPAGLKMPAGTLGGMLASLEAKGILEKLAGVFTGYFAAADQVEAAADCIAGLKRRVAGLVYFCDPVLGDDPGGLYVDAEAAARIRSRLVPLADMIAPNRFELEWLSGHGIANEEDAAQAAQILGVSETLATSIPSEGGLATMSMSGANRVSETSPRRPAVPHGTGDLLSGLYLGHRLNAHSPAEALARAMSRLTRVIAASEGSTTLDLRKGFA